ncbi:MULTISPECIES: hypothetical protein [unclassified Paenibacillus]|uniref:hypothetical protein n=1 Tax=unclassified Paenibacillus TaxID=185978 RepID=UPI00034ECE51|nr:MULTISPECIES: hypothetical protein [unclassified Paenibacillus]EPD81345.1 hypothetical protein HMPREF1207_05103 [Paenibacillus sp. HGH0039]
MEWKLISIDGERITDANCQYDSLDLATMLESATKVIVDFDKKETTVLKMK